MAESVSIDLAAVSNMGRVKSIDKDSIQTLSNTLPHTQKLARKVSRSLLALSVTPKLGRERERDRVTGRIESEKREAGLYRYYVPHQTRRSNLSTCASRLVQRLLDRGGNGKSR